MATIARVLRVSRQSLYDTPAGPDAQAAGFSFSGVHRADASLRLSWSYSQSRASINFTRASSPTFHGGRLRSLD